MIRGDVLEALNEENPDAIFFDGLDDCILGIGAAQYQPPVVVYSTQKIIDNLMGQGMSEEEAEEYFSFNIMGAYLGEHTPIILRDRD